MAAITHQRNDNLKEIIRKALVLYDDKTDDKKREMFAEYVAHIARTYSVKQQREWIELLNKKIEAI
jgi:hypothetical protein